MCRDVTITQLLVPYFPKKLPQFTIMSLDLNALDFRQFISFAYQTIKSR